MSIIKLRVYCRKYYHFLQRKVHHFDRIDCKNNDTRYNSFKQFYLLFEIFWYTILVKSLCAFKMF